MIGTLPVARLGPLDYRYAIDAVIPLLDGQVPLVCCGVAELEAEIRQRIPRWSEVRPARAALWVEPLAETWQANLQMLSGRLHPGALLAVIASRPLARLLPERRSWRGRPLGLEPGGIGKMRRALVESGYVIEASYNVHTLFAIALNAFSRLADRVGRHEVGDRLHFAARLRYCAGGSLATPATVALLSARKGRR
jgi:hypothetical protein